MNINVPSPIPSLLPETAPFSPEQRAWLNGFLAGIIAPDGGPVTALSPEQAAAAMGGAAVPVDEDDGDAPWHDQTLPIDDRMSLAAGKPLRSRMMAAMAQQDCGQCGYDCLNYAKAITNRAEVRLNLCVPGGKSTQRMLKSLAAELDAAPVTVANGASETITLANTVPAAEPGRSRENPAEAMFLSRRLLNRPGSEKETWHVEFDLSSCGLTYEPGDSFGIYPTNDPVLADAVIAAIGAPKDAPLSDGRTLRDVLIRDLSLSPAPDSLFQLYSYLTGGERRKKAQALGAGDDPDGDASTLDVLAAIEKFPGVRPDPEAFAEALEPLQPRLYSISSSLRAAENRISLTVDTVRYSIGERQRLGVTSHFLGTRCAEQAPLKVYVQKAHGFALPADPATPIVMIGPGTGVAPFRAFLQERQATCAPGRNWFFFGHQRRDCDFFYEDEFAAMKSSGLLTRLTLAWSRDGAEKIYVQDRMREVGRDLWSWLADGAHFYVCGDAQRMAKDVERALVDVVAQYGARSTDEAIAFVAGMRKSGRYCQDVY